MITMHGGPGVMPWRTNNDIGKLRNLIAYFESINQSCDVEKQALAALETDEREFEIVMGLH